MAKIVKPNMSYHDMRVRNDRGDGELLIVGRSKRGVYLWVGKDKGDVCTFTGQATLRKLARRILEIVGDEP